MDVTVGTTLKDSGTSGIPGVHKKIGGIVCQMRIILAYQNTLWTNPAFKVSAGTH
jgi:hypothetical protein